MNITSATPPLSPQINPPTTPTRAPSISLHQANPQSTQKNNKTIAIDIGGSLAKIVHLTREGQLVFQKFETENMNQVMEYVRAVQTELLSHEDDEQLDQDDDEHKIKVVVTGGGAVKFPKLFKEKLNVDIIPEDEMFCLIQGINFLVSEIPYETFTWSNGATYIDKVAPEDMFPYILVNIGSGVSILKVTSSTAFERISGTSLGGGTLWGLLSLLTGPRGFDEMLEMSEQGQNQNVDMLVGDIYGSDYSKVGLKATTIASSFGKVFKKETNHEDIKKEDICRSLLFAISNNIGQIAYLNAVNHNIAKIYFGGHFCRGHPISMTTLTYAVNFWSKGAMRPYFMRHEGYLGAVGAFLQHTSLPRTSRQEEHSFQESFTQERSSLVPSSFPVVGSLNTLSSRLTQFPLLTLPYTADTFDLLSSPELREYWMKLLNRNLEVLTSVINSTTSTPGRISRLETFSTVFGHYLQRLNENSSRYIDNTLSLQRIFEAREQCLREVGLDDVYSDVKRQENEHSSSIYCEVVARLDGLRDPLEAMIEGILAGNMFDWGAYRTLELITEKHLSFETSRKEIRRSNKVLYRYDEFENAVRSISYKKIMIFVDNSGADIVLGVIPFARYFLKMGRQVTLVANSLPAINDITSSELDLLLRDVLCPMDPILDEAYRSNRLTVVSSGSGSPCIDFKMVSLECAVASTNVDLLVIVGMGRAVLSNFRAKFKVDHLKLAVIKNERVAGALQGEIFDGVCIWEPGQP